MKTISNKHFFKNQLKYLFSIVFIFYSLHSLLAQVPTQALNNRVNLLKSHHPLSLSLYEAGNLSIGFGSENLPFPFYELAYSPIKHIDFQANYSVENWYQAKDFTTKIGIGTYYFLPTRKNKPKLISENWGQSTGFLINTHVGYLTGIKKLKIDYGNGYVLADESRLNYGGYFYEVGIQYRTAISSFQIMLSNSHTKYNKIILTDAAQIDESFWSFVDYTDTYNNFDLYSFSLRYSLCLKQATIFYELSQPIKSWGNTDFLIDEILNLSENDAHTTFLLGATINIDKIFPKMNWQLNKILKHKKSINE